MFEKEAEEYADKYKPNFVVNENGSTVYTRLDIEQAFLAGAEFGYNKAKEEMQELGLALQSDMDKTVEQNIALKKQIEKMRNCSNCNGIVMGGLRTDKCKRCIRYKDFPEWEIKEND